MMQETSIYEYAKQGLKLSPEKTAIWFYGKSISYKNLFRCIDNVADNLYFLGVREGTVVTIHLPNCPQAVMAVYAVAKLGGICNMVHPLTPLKALKENMVFTESEILITGDHFSDVEAVDFVDKLLYVGIASHMGLVYRAGYKIKNRGEVTLPNVVSFETLEKSIAPAIVPEQRKLSDVCALYLNSSGTTGTPKTVMLSHCACNNWVGNAKKFFREKSLEKEVVLSVLPFFHGSGLVMNMHQTLCAGGTQVLMARWNAKEAARFIKKYKITVLTGVPFLYQSLLEQKLFRGKSAKRISQCYVSGDSTPIELKDVFDSRVGHRVLFEGYGMTETVTACFSTSLYNPNADASGYPLDNCFAAVLCPSGQIRSEGTGELLLSTNTMMMGYLKAPTDTSEVFIWHDGKKWFRTGDYGVIDEDGYIYFKERIKNIIIRNGYNIYPGEIEALIRSIDFVVDVAVIGVQQSGARGEDICAFVVCKNQECEKAIEGKIHNICIAGLPRYAIPNRIMVISEIPRNRMNKVDKIHLEKLL